jgi:hypothetical protein
MICPPVHDRERYQRVWLNDVYALRDVYQMAD